MNYKFDHISLNVTKVCKCPLFKNVKFTLKPHNLHGIKYPNYYTVFYLKSVMRAKLNSPDVPKAHEDHPDSIVLYVEIEKPTNKSCVVM